MCINMHIHYGFHYMELAANGLFDDSDLHIYRYYKLQYYYWTSTSLILLDPLGDALPLPFRVYYRRSWMIL